MAHEHLYEPLPCSYWPEDLLRVVGTAYRKTRGQGLEGLVSLAQAEAAYIAAGGPEADARTLVLGMLASLSAEHGDWLWGPAQAWRDRHAPAIQEPAWAETEDGK